MGTAPVVGQPLSARLLASRPGRRFTQLTGRVTDRLAPSVLARAHRRLAEVAVMESATMLAAFALATFVPLLIVVDAVSPVASGRGFGDYVVSAFGLTGHPAQAVENLFASAQQVRRVTTWFGLLGLPLFALAFTGALQRAYERVWRLPPLGWRTHWRQVVWLAGFVGYLIALLALRTVAHRHPVSWLWLGACTLSMTLGLFWAGPYLLLGHRVSWWRLLPGAVCTAVAAVGLGAFSSLIYSGFLTSNADQYGPIGAVFVLLSWLIGAGVVVVGAAAVGAAWVEHRSGSAAPPSPGFAGRRPSPPSTDPAPPAPDRAGGRAPVEVAAKRCGHRRPVLTSTHTAESKMSLTSRLSE